MGFTLRAASSSDAHAPSSDADARNDACGRDLLVATTRGYAPSTTTSTTTKSTLPTKSTTKSLAAVCLLGGLSLAALLPPDAHAASFVVPGLVGDNELREGFTSGLLLILVSEIGDKTFFVALILAVRESAKAAKAATNPPAGGGGGGSGSAIDGKTAVFAGTFAALAIMTLISCAIGRTFHNADELISALLAEDASGARAVPAWLAQAARLPLDDIAAAALLTSFGLTSLRAALSNDDDDEGGEEQEAREFLAEQDNAQSANGAAPASGSGAGAGAGQADDGGPLALAASTFALVFAAEWGDRSFLATIALCAAYPPLGVVSGAVAGHGMATALAGGGGSVLAKYISEKAVAVSGAVLFLAFAAATLYDLALELPSP